MGQRFNEAINFKLKSKQDRMMFYILFSVLGDFFMGTIKLILAISTLSIWLFANAGFSLVIGITRYFSIRDYAKMRYEKNQDNKLGICYKNYRNNGRLLIALGIIYFLISLYLSFNNPTVNMHEFVVYAVATMTFYSLGMSIYGAVRYRKEEDTILRATKFTNNADALTSIVLTQVVLLSTFGEEVNYSLYNGSVGMLMSTVIMAIGLFMVKDKRNQNRKNHPKMV